MSTENKSAKAPQIKESVIIKNITYVTTKVGQQLVILHTTPCKVLKDKDGVAVCRFKLNRKVFEQRAREVNKPLVIFEKQCIGASYEYVAQPVNSGDAWLTGEGTYTVAHNAKVSDKITISAAAMANDTKAATEAYYAAMFSPSVQEVAPVAMSLGSSTEENEQAGSDIQA